MPAIPFSVNTPNRIQPSLLLAYRPSLFGEYKAIAPIDERLKPNVPALVVGFSRSARRRLLLRRPSFRYRCEIAKQKRKPADSFPPWVRRKRARLSVGNSKIDEVSLDAALYARFSATNQKPCSIEIQLRHAKNYANAKSFVVRREYSEIARTGKSFKNREAYAKMIEDAERGVFKHIVLYNISRFCRTWRQAMKQFDILLALGVTIHTPDHGVIDEARMLDLARQAENHHAGLMKDTKEGRLQAVEDGKVPMRPSFGFMATDVPGVHVPHPVHSKTVMRAFELMDGLIGSTTTGRIMTKEGLMTPADAERVRCGREPLGEAWTRGKVLDVCKSRRCIGLIDYNTTNVVRNDEWEIVGRTSDERAWRTGVAERMAFLDPARFERVQARFNNGEIREHRMPAVYPLAKLMLCAVCEGPLRISHAASEPAYCCYEIDPKTRERCTAKGLHPVRRMDRYVLEALSSLFEGEGRLDAFRADHATRLELRTRLSDELIKGLEQKLEDAMAAVRSITLLEMANAKLAINNPRRRPEDVLTGMVIDANKDHQDAKDALEAELEKSRKADVDRSVVSDLDELGKIFKNLDKVLKAVSENLDGGRLKSALRRIVEKVTLNRLSSKGGELVIYTKLPDIERPGFFKELEVAFDNVAIRLLKSVEKKEVDRIRLGLIAADPEQGPDEKTYELADACAAHHGFKDPKRVGLRKLVAAMLFVLHNEIPWKDLPLSFGHKPDLKLAMGRLIACGAWDEIIDVWTTHNPNALRGLSRRVASFPSANRSLKTRTKSAATTTAVPTSEELRTAAAQLENGPVKTRLLVIAMLRGGAKPKDVATRLGLKRQQVKNLRTIYWTRAVGDFQKRPKQGFLTDAEWVKVAEFVEGRRLSSKGITACSLSEVYDFAIAMGVRYKSKTSFHSGMTKHDIFLRDRPPETT